MNNVHINYAETVFEPFYDSGESYPDNYKYSRLNGYEIKYADGVKAEVTDTWYGNNICITAQPEGVYAVSMEKSCSIDIKDFDIFRFCGVVDKSVKCRFTCVVDGRETTVLEFTGIGKRYEYDGRISGERITKIKMEFMNTGRGETNICLHWLGLSNLAKQTELRNTPSAFDSNWEGCFNDSFEISPMIGIYFNASELESLRKKLEEPEYREIMQVIRERAEAHLLLEPEKDIKTTVATLNIDVGRYCETDRIPLTDKMKELAFTGIIDKNADMLRMACRMALSLSCSGSWSDNFMEMLPGTTWCRRSFSMDECCRACSAVLDWAGNLLTWHGKNIIYHAMIMKGLPRIEADFKTVEYIRHTNQGIVFSRGRICALIALADRYPRYGALLNEAEHDFYEILEDYIAGDGGVIEGPGYWDYSLLESVPTLYMLSKYHKKTMRECVPDAVLRAEKYGLALLSDSENFEYLPINDSHYHRQYHTLIALLYSAVGKSKIWKSMYKKFLDDKVMLDNSYTEEILIMAPQAEELSENETTEDFVSLDKTGQTSVRFESATAGKVHLHLISGETCFCHAHEDKGSLILEVDSVPVLIDRGCCPYGSAGGEMIRKAEYHNLLCPLDSGGKAYTQPSYPDGYGGKVLKAEKHGNAFIYETELSGAWEEAAFEKALRRIKTETADSFTVEDEVIYKEGEKESMFLLNTPGEITECKDGFKISQGNTELTITPKNWKPVKAKFGEYGIGDDLKPVNRLALYTDKSRGHHLLTEIKIRKKER